MKISQPVQSALLVSGLLGGLLLAAPATAAPAAASAADAEDGFAWAASRARTQTGELAGRVTAMAAVTAMTAPLATASVYAYEMAGLELTKTETNGEGGFFFRDLPAGLYKVIAFKKGFVPAVMVLRRATAQAQQFLEVELRPQPEDPSAAAASFWEVRERIPNDVLRDIQYATVEPETATAPGATLVADANFEAVMEAVAGVQEGLDYGSLDVTGAQVGVKGQINDYRVAFDGSFAELEGREAVLAEDSNPANGSSQRMSLRLEDGEGKSTINVASRSNKLVTSDESSEVDFQHHAVSWSRLIGKSGRSDFTAQYTEENNFYGPALLEPMGMPTGSRSWHLEGSYSGNVSKKATVEAGVSYRDRKTDSGGEAYGYGLLPRESVELFGRGGLAVKPAMVVEYGLYSTLRDGSLSLSPQGGLVFEFGPNWRASTKFSRRINSDHEEAERPRDFIPAYFGDRAACRQGEDYCYEVLASRLLGKNEEMTLGAVHRKIGETQRLYFSDDFFNRLDSLYLVEGDTLPELKFELTRRLAPAVMTRLRSNVASGGGGMFYSTQEEAPFENSVRYLVTSLDTRFEDTRTGIFVAFHRLEQELEPVVNTANGAIAAEQQGLELERLQLMLSQDLDILHSMASDWAVHLNMELSRGGALATGLPEDELRKRVTGGLAVKF